MKKPSICISPIDWGLGHATRCITLIKGFEKLGYQVYIATEGYHEAILKEALPTAQFLHLRGYRIRYAKWGFNLPLVLLFQVPQIIYSIIYEYRWLQKAQAKYNFDLIVSDNRFGFYHKSVPSVFITHQLNLQMHFEVATRLFQKIQYAWLKRFTACWIPDMEGSNNLSGILANPNHKPSIPLWYMGCLSRLIHTPSRIADLNNARPTVFLGIVSGPEPQRTLFENLLWKAGNSLNIPFVVIAGRPSKDEPNKIIEENKNAKLYAHLAAPELVMEIKRAEFIICRGGYTTLMELIPFGKKLIFIPTPGQTEQMYLGKLWEEKNWALCYAQEYFNLGIALKEASSFNFQAPPFIDFSIEDLKTAIKQLTL
ncbi:MAG: glycosyltransferase [Bacteroidetes bacterium]|nr:glycosyltransferase [Bacteroidota bacterium]